MDKFITQKGDMVQVQCNSCVHRRASATCDAFPDGIPKVILMNEIDHREPFPGDHGIQFELKPRAESPYPDDK